MEPNTFKYRPLVSDEIRLLKLESAWSQGSQIRGSLVHVSVKHPPRYWALSYVWGSMKTDVPIRLDKEQFHITRNLSEALTSLRGWFLDVLIWVDAISIDQSNTKERNVQVPRMVEIYGKASKTIAWLGPSNSILHKAMDHLREWASDNYSHRYHNEYPETCSCVKSDSKLFDDAACKAVSEFFENQWWNRIWTYQECLVSTNLIFVCGDEELDWDAISLAYDLSDTLASYPSRQNLNVRQWDNMSEMIDSFNGNSLRIQKDYYSKFQKTGLWDRITDSGPNLQGSRESSIPEAAQAELWRRQQEWMTKGSRYGSRLVHLASAAPGSHLVRYNFGIDHLVGEGFSRECSNPRDKIYGFVGADATNLVSIAADYDKTVAEVYASFVAQVSEQKGELRILSWSGIGARSDASSHNLPSWVPDFSDRLHMPVFDSGHLESWYSSFQESVASFSDDLRVMTSPVLRAGTIKAVGSYYEKELPMNGKAITDWEKFTAENYTASMAKVVPWRQAFCRLLVTEESGTFISERGHSFDSVQRKAFIVIALMASSACSNDPSVSGNNEVQSALLKRTIDGRLSYLLNLFATWVKPSTELAPSKGLFEEKFLGPCDSFAAKHWDFEYNPNMEELNGAGKGFGDYVRLSSETSRIFATADGFVGKGPRPVQVGDIICCIPGCLTPLIVRPRGRDHIIIGNCYIDHMMNGQLFGADNRTGNQCWEEMSFS
jgi:hypothetical protein